MRSHSRSKIRSQMKPLEKFLNSPHFDGATDFRRIEPNDFLPALNQAIRLAKKRIQEVRNAPAGFRETILGLESAAYELQAVASVLFNLYAACKTDELDSIVQTCSNKIEDFQFEIAHDQIIFQKVEEIYLRSEKSKDGLDPALTSEDRRLIAKIYADFSENGGKLTAKQKQRLQTIDRKLSLLSQSFAQNVESAKSDFRLHILSARDLKGLPENLIRQAKAEAKALSLEGWVITLDDWSYGPFMKYSEVASLREDLWRAQGSLCVAGPYDNRQNIIDIVRLRAEKASLFGEKSFADLTIKNRMHADAGSVNLFLDRLLAAATKAGAAELNEIKSFSRKELKNPILKPWDVDFVTAQLKKRTFKLHEEEFRKHLSISAVTRGILELSKKLFGLKLKANKAVPVYRKDVLAFSVFDSGENYLGLLYVDYFRHAGKQEAGAWMTTYREQCYQGSRRIHPHVAIVFNFPSGQNLTLDDLEIVLHELGHAFHELLSDSRHRSLAGSKVNLDFVELPSHLLVNWAHHPRGLRIFAKNAKPKQINAILRALKFQSGLLNHMQTRLMKIDLGWSSLSFSEAKKLTSRDVETFENSILKNSDLFTRQPGHNLSCTFENIFVDEYAASFYSYKWAQVLEADIFTEFEKNGLFHKATAVHLKSTIYSKGALSSPDALFRDFKGRDPSIQSYLRRENLKDFHAATKVSSA